MWTRPLVCNSRNGSGWLQWVCSFLNIMFTFHSTLIPKYCISTLCRIHCLSAGFLYASQSSRITSNYAATTHRWRVILWSKNESFLLLSFPFHLRRGIFLICHMLQYARGHVCGLDGQMWHFFSINSMTLAIMCLTVLWHPNISSVFLDSNCCRRNKLRIPPCKEKGIFKSLFLLF